MQQVMGQVIGWKEKEEEKGVADNTNKQHVGCVGWLFNTKYLVNRPPLLTHLCCIAGMLNMRMPPPMSVKPVYRCFFKGILLLLLLSVCNNRFSVVARMLNEREKNPKHDCGRKKRRGYSAQSRKKGN